MKIYIILVLIALAVCANAQHKLCKKCNATCTRSEECCQSYCRSDKCVPWGTIPDEKGPNPCDTKNCNGGRCVIREVWCIRSPCPGLATCLEP